MPLSAPSPGRAGPTRQTEIPTTYTPEKALGLWGAAVQTSLWPEGGIFNSPDRSSRLAVLSVLQQHHRPPSPPPAGHILTVDALQGELRLLLGFLSISITMAERLLFESAELPVQEIKLGVIVRIAPCMDLGSDLKQ